MQLFKIYSAIDLIFLEASPNSFNRRFYRIIRCRGKFLRFIVMYGKIRTRLFSYFKFTAHDNCFLEDPRIVLIENPIEMSGIVKNSSISL